MLLLLSTSFSAWAQGGMGQIGGQVLDQAGAVIPNVTVTATNTATGVVTTAVSNEVGSYVLLRLIPGTYTLTVEHPGFKKLVREDVLIQVGDRLNVDLPLQVGQASESVSVTAEVPLVRTEDAQTGEVINNKMIQDLPQLNRDPLALVRLAGNVQGEGDRATAGNTLRINGGRTQGIEYFVDGVTVGTGMARNVSYNTPTTEAVAEFRVVTNGIAAEYGRLSGGAVELVTKSGSNAFHGQLFEYIKNRAFNANTWISNKNGIEKDNFQENIYGGAVGGPVWIPKVYDGRNKTFFFFNYEGYRFRQAGTPQFGSVPTEAMRNGDFTNVCLRGTCAKLYDQNGRVEKEADGQYYRQDLLNDGYHILPSQMDPIAKAMLQFVPLPNREPAAGTSWVNNYVGTSRRATDRTDWAIRVDQNIGSNHKLFARFTTHDYLNNPNSRWYGPGQAINEDKNKGMFAATLNYDWTMSPTTILTMRFGGNHTPYTSGSTVDPQVMAALPFDSVTKALVGSNGSIELWAPDMTQMLNQASANVTNETTYNANISMVKIMNRHMLKFGYDHRRFYDNFANGASGYMLTTGRTVKRGAFDSGWNDEDYVLSFAGFLQGYISHYGVSGEKSRAMNFNYHAAYVQDDWRVTDKLTLGLGLRWDVETPVTERYDKLYFWDTEAASPFQMKPGYNWQEELQKGFVAAGLDPALASNVPNPTWLNGFPTGAARIANTPEFPDRYGTKYKWNQFAPRFSAAYQASEKTVLRGSIGQIYMSRAGDANALSTAGGAMALADSYGEVWHANDPNVPYYKMSQTLSNPFRPQDYNTYVRDTYKANQQVTGGDPTLIAYDRNSHMPWEWVWNFNVQRQLSQSFVAEIGYNGNRGQDLLAQDLIHRFPGSEFVPSKANIYNTVTVATPVLDTTKYGDTIPLPIALYPTPYFGPVSVQGINYGRSQYHGMTARLEKRMSQGYGFLLNYTLSRLNDNVGGPNSSNGGIVSSGTGSHAPQSTQSIRDVYGISPIDRTHNLRAYYQVELPFGRGRKWGSDTSTTGAKILDGIIGGWELAGISSWSSGVPIHIDGSNANNKPSRVEYVWSSYTSSDRDLGSSNYKGQDSIFYSQDVDPAVRQSGPRRLDPSKVINPDEPGGPRFQLGDVDPIYGGVRQPWRIYHDMSLMKKFNFTESVYLQFRAEAENVFNMRGWPDIIDDPRSSDYGLMLGENGFNHGPRRIQLSARLVF
jgi:hypothetical protein